MVGAVDALSVAHTIAIIWMKSRMEMNTGQTKNGLLLIALESLSFSLSLSLYIYIYINRNKFHSPLSREERATLFSSE